MSRKHKPSSLCKSIPNLSIINALSWAIYFASIVYQLQSPGPKLISTL